MNKTIQSSIQKYLKSLTVLYVEDDESIRTELAEFLKRRVGTLILAADGQDAWSKFSEQSVDLVITDIKMPHMNGLILASKIKEQSPSTPILITTAFEQTDYLIDAIRIGVDKYIIKPIDTSLMMRDLMACVKQSHADQQLELINQLFDNNKEGILVTDKTNSIIMVNKAFSKITGYMRDEVIGKSPKLLASGRHDDVFYDNMWQEINAKGSWQGEIWDKRKNGEIFPQWMSISTLLNDAGQVSHYMAMFANISQWKADEERLKYLASHDVLTGLPNRNTLYDLMSLSFANADRNKESVAILFVDLDEFKPVNDNYGHHVGDILLQNIARRLTATLRSGDTISRLGGDEFIIVLTNAENRDDLSATVVKIQQIIAKPIDIDGYSLSVTSSIGISLYPEHSKYAERLISYADTAMYQAKKLDNSDHVFYQES